MLIAFSLALFAMGCKGQQVTAASPDDEVFRKLLGVWAGEYKYASGSEMNMTITVAPDGSYVSKLSIPGRERGPRFIEQRGTWRVQSGTIIDTVTSDSQTNFAVPYTNRMRVLRVDDRELAFEMEHIPGAVLPTNQRVLRKEQNR